MTRELFFAAALLSAPMAFAQQPPCGPVDQVLKSLQAEVGEVPVGMGRDERGFVALMTLTPGGTSYTMLAVRPDGTACLLSTGDGWKVIEPKPPGRES
jgi:hypothetical protein